MTHTQPATPAVRPYPKSVCPRSTQLKVAHRLAEQLGYETRVGKPGRERYEAKLQEIVGLRSLKNASREQRNRVISELERDLAAQRPVYAAARNGYDADDFSDDAVLSLLEVA